MSEHDASGTLVSWEEGIGDDTRYHIAYVSSDGVTLIRKMKDHRKWQTLVVKCETAPEQTDEVLSEASEATFFPYEQMQKVTFAEQLNQLMIFDGEGRKTKVPDGKGNPQEQIFTAIRRQTEQTVREEDADVWSVLQGPLFILSVLGVIGGFLIYFTTICDPSYEASGRRAGMKQLMNWLGYSIGPVWMSVLVGAPALLVICLATFQLIRRPVRMVLEL